MTNADFNPLRYLLTDDRGAVLVETAIALPILGLILSGIISYSTYMMAAHSLQSVANEGARASIAGVNASERSALISDAISKSLTQATLVDRTKVAVETNTDGRFFTVKLDYDARDHVAFRTSLVPMPDTRIVRSATVELPIY